MRYTRDNSNTRPWGFLILCGILLTPFGFSLVIALFDPKGENVPYIMIGQGVIGAILGIWLRSRMEGATDDLSNRFMICVTAVTLVGLILTKTFLAPRLAAYLRPSKGTITTAPLAIKEETLASSRQQEPPVTSEHKPGRIQQGAPPNNHSFINTLGMNFVPVPGAHVLMCIHETRNMDYAAYAAVASGVEEQWKVEAVGRKDKYPVVNVSYDDAEGFCRWLSVKEGKNYRLPSDSGWSAAVGSTEFPWGNHFPPSPQDGNYGSKLVFDGYKGLAPVMTFHPNRLGIFDMGGNVFEWCSTWFTADLNDAETRAAFSFMDDDETKDGFRVIRGAAWNFHEEAALRSTCRFNEEPDNRRDSVGFRCVLELRSP